MAAFLPCQASLGSGRVAERASAAFPATNENARQNELTDVSTVRWIYCAARRCVAPSSGQFMGALASLRKPLRVYAPLSGPAIPEGVPNRFTHMN